MVVDVGIVVLAVLVLLRMVVVAVVVATDVVLVLLLLTSRKEIESLLLSINVLLTTPLVWMVLLSSPLLSSDIWDKSVFTDTIELRCSSSGNGNGGG